MTHTEALKLALEALELHLTHHEHGCVYLDPAVIAIKEALTQPAQEEKFCDSNCVWTDHHPDCNLAQPPYRAVKTYHGGKPVYVAEPEQEPVAWMDADGNVSDNNDHNCFPIPLYTTPPQRKPLTNNCKHEWMDETKDHPRWRCIKCGENYTKENT
jgi:hypothetical protein